MGRIDQRNREEIITGVKERYARISSSMNELSRRLWAGNECISIGYGGIAIVSGATGMARNTVAKGRDEAKAGRKLNGRVREKGAGRKRTADSNPGLTDRLRDIIDPFTRGDPMSPVLWTSKSLRKLAVELQKEGYSISYRTVRVMLRDMGYSLKSNRKKDEGKSEPDRNNQFEHINNKVMYFMSENQPVISIDTKKKEPIGNFRNPGKEWNGKHPVNTMRSMYTISCNLQWGRLYHMEYMT